MMCDWKNGLPSDTASRPTTQHKQEKYPHNTEYTAKNHNLTKLICLFSSEINLSLLKQVNFHPTSKTTTSEKV